MFTRLQLLTLPPFAPRTGEQQTEVQVSKQDAKLLIDDFDDSKEYNFNIFAISRGRESKPLQAKFEGKRRSPEPFTSGVFRCHEDLAGVEMHIQKCID